VHQCMMGWPCTVAAPVVVPVLLTPRRQELAKCTNKAHRKLLRCTDWFVVALVANIFPCLSCMAENTIASTFQLIGFFYSGTESSTSVVLVFTTNLFFVMVDAMLYLIGSQRIVDTRHLSLFFF